MPLLCWIIIFYAERLHLPTKQSLHSTRYTRPDARIAMYTVFLLKGFMIVFAVCGLCIVIFFLFILLLVFSCIHVRCSYVPPACSVPFCVWTFTGRLILYRFGALQWEKGKQLDYYTAKRKREGIRITSHHQGLYMYDMLRKRGKNCALLEIRHLFPRVGLLHYTIKSGLVWLRIFNVYCSHSTLRNNLLNILENVPTAATSSLMPRYCWLNIYSQAGPREKTSENVISGYQWLPGPRTGLQQFQTCELLFARFLLSSDAVLYRALRLRGSNCMHTYQYIGYELARC